MNRMELCHMRAQGPRDGGNLDRQQSKAPPVIGWQKRTHRVPSPLIIEIAERVLRPIIGFALLFVSVTAAAQPQGPEGVWLTEDRGGAVEIFDCGTHLCGRIVWQRSPLRPDGSPDIDDHNPDPALRHHPICGLQIIGNLSPSGPAKWSGGWVYDPDHGQTYGAELTLESRDALRMRGYIAIPLFGGSQLWRRAPANLPRCPTAG
jgi:uncharacterized protein (DUF2147 family)